MQSIDIQPTCGRATVYAGEYLLLDSDVSRGGGTNQTALLQAILDKAEDWGCLHLVMDGAALVDGLRIHSNTTIECVSASCGFYLDDHRSEPLLQNAHPCLAGERMDRNIRLIGGTYNQNCRNQAHHVEKHEEGPWPEEGRDWVMCMKWYGVEELTLRDVTIRDQASFGIHVANFHSVCMENIHIDIPHLGFLRNQDGIHFWGPGRFLTLRNIRGTAGDDFIALAPDEGDGVSSITDVLIDGVQLEEADQGIRMLSKGLGRLDRVTVRNVTGTYKSYGFFLNPWFYGTQREGGSYGNILIENVDLRQTAPKYTHYTPFLFRIGGNFEVLTLRNIAHHQPSDSRPVIEIDQPYHEPHPQAEKRAYVSDIGALIVDGLTIYQDEESAPMPRYLYINGRVRRLCLQNIRLIRTEEAQAAGSLLTMGPGGRVDQMETDTVTAQSLG